MNEVIQRVTKTIIERSKESRKIYLKRIELAKNDSLSRKNLGCSNLAHAMAPMSNNEKLSLDGLIKPNIAIITAYNDMLSAHKPFETYPNIIKKTLLENGATAQVAGGVPAMCDGITQSQPGMELSLFSRDNIAMGTAIGLSHNVFDAALYLGVCDKIVPGMLIGALSFGHLPAIFVPAGPMPSGISNLKKAKIREEYKEGKVDENTLLEAESASYHSCGTCTFYGTANSNQMLLEMMGLQLPNSSFINANTPLRDELTKEAARTLLSLTKYSKNYKAVADIIDERSIVNAMIGLITTGGSTNHTIHLIAIANAAGIKINWDDFDAISKEVPLLCKMYPNGSADVNDFRDAGAMSVVIAELIKAGLIHEDVETVVGKGLSNYIIEPVLEKDTFSFKKGPIVSRNKEVISSIDLPFNSEGGIKLLRGNIGRSIIKTSALNQNQLFIEAPALIFNSQEELQTAFVQGKLNKNFIAVVKYQGPKANGMPELHGLMPILGLLQGKGFKVALVTDGRMSGASGKVPAAIHMTPEASKNGIISKIKNGDIIRLDAQKGELSLLLNEQTISERKSDNIDLTNNQYGFGRELFSTIRENVGSAEEGASIFKTISKDKI